MPPKKIKESIITTKPDEHIVEPKKTPKKSTKKTTPIVSEPEPQSEEITLIPTDVTVVTEEKKKAPRKNKKNIDTKVDTLETIAPEIDVVSATTESKNKTKGNKKSTNTVESVKVENTTIELVNGNKKKVSRRRDKDSENVEDNLSPQVIHNIIYHNACEYNKLMQNINNNTDIPDNLIEIMAFIVMPLNDLSIYKFWEKSNNKFGGHINIEKLKKELKIEI
jgi:hypothetical protein